MVSVSVILPVYNAGKWLDECLLSILNQNVEDGTFEISIFLDSCTDDSLEIVQKYATAFIEKNHPCLINIERNVKPRGVGYAKNRAVGHSHGSYLCFMDSDDVMHPNRIKTQLDIARKNGNTIVGSLFRRIPADATRRYTDWANSTSAQQLYLQAFMSHGPTLIMPTWFCPRATYDTVGGFSEAGKGEPEDLIFFYRHLRLGGKLVRAEEELLSYRYHEEAASFSVSEERIWELRVRELSERVLCQWGSFTVWNAGKQGRKLYRSLAPDLRKKVVSFCDVDSKKVGKVYTFEDRAVVPRPTVPIVHFRDAEPPFVICVKLGLTGGQFEENLESLHLQEGKDYYHFN